MTMVNVETPVEVAPGVRAPLADLLAAADLACPQCEGTGQITIPTRAGAPRQQVLCSCAVANYREEHAACSR